MTDTLDLLRAAWKGIVSQPGPHLQPLQTSVETGRKLIERLDNLEKALIAHHLMGHCICADFDFVKACTCWMSLNTGRNGMCEKCGGIKKSETKT